MARKIDLEGLPPLGQAIMKLVEAKGYKTLKDACEASGVGYLHCRYIVQGEKTPRLATLQEVIAKLGGTFGDFEALIPPAPTEPPGQAKRAVTWRISNETREQLLELKQRHKGTTEGAIVEWAIRELYQREGTSKRKGKGLDKTT